MAIVYVEEGNNLFAHFKIVPLGQMVQFLLEPGLLAEDVHHPIRLDYVQGQLG